QPKGACVRLPGARELPPRSTAYLLRSWRAASRSGTTTAPNLRFQPNGPGSDGRDRVFRQACPRDRIFDHRTTRVIWDGAIAMDDEGALGPGCVEAALPLRSMTPLM